jgi:hypothetical protein
VPEWKKRKRGTPNQIGKPFIMEPHGDKRNLPKALRQVSFGEITDAIQDRRRDKMTEDELAEEEMLEEMVEAEMEQKGALQKLKDGIEKVDRTLKKEKARSELRQALEEAKDERVQEEASDIDEGYGAAWNEALEKKRKERQKDFNPLMGDVP